MKLLRIKITDPMGFRSLPCGFEHDFRSDEMLEDELANPEDFAPFVCAGPNGSGKSNLLEALAAIFFQLEILRVRRSFLPEVLQNADEDFSPVAFELDYLIRVPSEYIHPDGPVWAKVSVWKNTGESVRFFWDNQSDFDASDYEAFDGGHADFLMPQYVVGYSSGENEILSLPFFKLRFVQFDEYWNALTQQLSYPGYPETRLAYLDNGFSQAILLCNLLFQDEATLRPFREDVGIEGLREFRIILKRRIEVSAKQAAQSTSNEYISSGYSQDSYFVDNPAISSSPETGAYTVNLMHLMEGDERSSIIEKLKRCATLSYQDHTTDTLILDYWVNEATREAFHDNFDGSPLSLFQAFQVLLVLNLYSVSDSLKADIYRSQSHYVSETVPTLASDERAMRFKHVYLKKRGISKPMLLKELSDGEHQLLHSLGLCLLFRNTNSLFLLDEPETHFNPAWRASFISRLRDCLQGQAETSQEIFITTHSPFLISDSKSNKVLVFEKNPENYEVSITHPNYNTFGASINKITNETFEKSETIGERARQILGDLLKGHLAEDDPTNLAKKIMDTVGESIERTLAVHALLHSDQKKNNKEEQD